MDTLAVQLLAQTAPSGDDLARAVGLLADKLAAPAASGSRVVDAAIIALFGGIVVATLTKLLEIGIDFYRRRQRRRDMIVALYYEILLGQQSATLQTKPDEAQYLESVNQPFGPSDRSDFVFDGLKDNLSILPDTLIKDIVLYYKWAERANRFTDHLLVDAYKDLSPARKDLFAKAILTATEQQRIAARSAIEALQQYMDTHKIGYARDAPGKLHHSNAAAKSSAAALAMVVAWRTVSRRRG